MTETEPEMREQNDPAEYAEGGVDERAHDELGGPEARNAGAPSPNEAEVRRHQVPDQL